MVYIRKFPFMGGDDILCKGVGVGIQDEQELADEIEGIIAPAAMHTCKQFQESFEVWYPNSRTFSALT